MKNFYLDLREQAVKLIIMKKRNDTINKWIKKKLDNGKKKIYSFWFMSSLFSSLVDKLSEVLHCDKCIDYKSYLDLYDNQRWSIDL